MPGQRRELPLGELAEEASRILEGELGPRAGSVGGIQVSDTVWSADGPGQGSVIIEGVEWRSWDYKEDIHVSEELAGMLQVSDEGRKEGSASPKQSPRGSWAAQ